MVKRSHPQNPNQTTFFVGKKRKVKITKLKQQVMPTYCHTDSTDVIENDYIIFF
jgi:hypothetical protein